MPLFNKNSKPTDKDDELTLKFSETGDSEDDDIDPLNDEDAPDLDEELDSNSNLPSTSSDNFRSIQENEDDVNPKDKVKRSIYVTKQTMASIEQLSRLRNVSGSKIVEYAIALYFKNYFERDFIQLSDIELFTEEVATLVAEQTQEVAHLGELVSRTLDAEMELPTEIL